MLRTQREPRRKRGVNKETVSRRLSSAFPLGGLDLTDLT